MEEIVDMNVRCQRVRCPGYSCDCIDLRIVGLETKIERLKQLLLTAHDRMHTSGAHVEAIRDTVKLKADIQRELNSG